MKNVFRRSNKSSNGDKSPMSPGHYQISIPQKDAIAIVPPKKVIKALYDYQPQNPNAAPGYLGFSQGDFLHVISREEDPDWFEACNPMTGIKGLVPVNYFEVIGKQARNSSMSEPAGRVGSNQYDSGYEGKSERNSGPSRAGAMSPSAQKAGPQHRPSPSVSKQGSMVYGMVLYDFKAERPDELDAKAGEAIVVIAQSNPEWFVAKPIQRLGGPGLVPVAYVELRDMTTGTAVSDAQEAITRANVPKVEDWKKMAAQYKNSSIPLGRLENTQGLTQSMQRLSVDSNRRSNDSGQHPSSSHSHQSQQSSRPQASRNPSSQHSFHPPAQPSPLYQQVNEQNTSHLLIPVRARVPKYCHQEMKFWFVVEAYMEDHRHYELNREYTDFFGLQTALMNSFPEAAGKIEGSRRTLPFMPGPLPWVTEKLTSDRREHMDRYLQQLLTMDTQIVHSPHVRSFFALREGDQEIEGSSDMDGTGSSESEWVRLSRSSRSSVPQDSRQSSTGNLSSGGAGYASPSKNQSYRKDSHQRSPSEIRSATPQGGNSKHSQQASSGGGQLMKIKVWWSDSNCVILRLPYTFSYDDLVRKLQERWILDQGGDRNSLDDTEFAIEWKDEASGGINGSWKAIETEDELRDAKEKSEKLVIRVGALGADV